MRAKQIFTAGILVAVTLLASGCQKLKARDDLNRGVQAFKATQYSVAVERFKEATDLDPDWEVPRLYLAMSYMSMWIPGAESAENNKFAQLSLDQFNKVLEKDPKNQIALKSIASIYFNQKKFDEASAWNRKVIEVDPNSKESYYTLGVIAWTKWVKEDLTERHAMGMKSDDPGPLKDKKKKEELKAKWMPSLDAGIADMNKALSIDPNYDDAMVFLNLLIRYRADLLDTAEEYKQQVDIAGNWVTKSMETKKANVAKKEKAAENGVKKSE